MLTKRTGHGVNYLPRLSLVYQNLSQVGPAAYVNPYHLA